jgi:hypothetical protein
MRGVRRVAVVSVVLAALAGPAVALARYGSIAVNPQTEAFGGSYNRATKKVAERHALRKCPGRCRVLLWVRDFCAAAVVDRRGFWGGFGATHVAAIRAARKHAHDQHATFLTWVCSG